MNLYYNFREDIGSSVNHSIERCSAEPPSWWKNLTAYLHGIKYKKDIINNLSTETLFNAGSFSTAKGCPAIQNFFKQSIKLKAPCDIILEVNDDGGVHWRTKSDDITVLFHNEIQAPGLSKDWVFVKFTYNIYWTTDKPVQVSYYDPVFYNNVPYKVSPGILHNQANEAQELNMIALFPKKQQRYFIEYGQTLAIMQFDDRVGKIEQKPLTKEVITLRNKFRTLTNVKRFTGSS